MTSPPKRDKRSWKRNTPPKGVKFQSKYGFSQHLKQVNDFIQTDVIPEEQYQKLKYAVHIWAWRKGVVVKTEKVYYPTGKGVRITLLRRWR